MSRNIDAFIEELAIKAHLSTEVVREIVFDELEKSISSGLDGKLSRKRRRKNPQERDNKK